MLACQRQELVPHAHSEGCYDEAGALVCGLPVVGEHQHSQDCVSVPDGEPQEVKTLVCGLEEHVHVDACYVELIPNENDKYFCKKEEHLHTRECYFESGALRCTLEEHLHTAACLEEQPDEPPEGTDDPPPQEPEPDPVPGVTLEDYPFVYEGEAFTVTYRISGVARLAEGNQPGDPSQEPEPTPSATDEPQPTEPPQGEVDLGGQEYIEIPLAFKPRGTAGRDQPLIPAGTLFTTASQCPLRARGRTIRPGPIPSPDIPPARVRSWIPPWWRSAWRSSPRMTPGSRP